MKLGIAHYVGSLEALDRQLDYTSISDDPENYHRCIARERTTEMEVCRQLGIPAFLVIAASDRRIHVSGHGAQNGYARFALLDADRRPVASLAGYDILLRSSVSHERYPLEYIESLGGRNVVDWASQQRTMEWYRHVRQEFVKRRLGVFPIDGAFDLDLAEFADETGRFFAKTSYKIMGCAGVTHSLLDLFGYDIELMPPSTEVIVSEPLDLQHDIRGKLEYRCFVVHLRVSSISRCLDYETDYPIPDAVVHFADAFVEAHRKVLPSCYVLDVAETDRGTVVIELNGIVASGRYERNSFRKLLEDVLATQPSN